MKIFDNWIKKQYHKRFIKPFRDTMPEPKVIVTKKPIMKSIQMIMLAKEADDLVDLETKKMELARKFIPVIANNMEIRREEEPRMHMVKYEALLEFIPAFENFNHKVYRNESCDRAGKCDDYIGWHCTGCNGAKEARKDHD